MLSPTVSRGIVLVVLLGVLSLFVWLGIKVSGIGEDDS